MKVLHIDSSVTGATSVSRQITARIVEAIRQLDPDAELARRDLEAAPLPHLDGQALAGLATNAALEEFLSADVIVIGAPMYNFGVSSQLKAWIDRISVAGKTFRYTENGPQGLAGGKKIIIASSRGGIYAAGSAAAAMDFQENYLRAVFQFLGITDLQVIRAEGIAMGPEQRDAALTSALNAAGMLAAPASHAEAA
jgi:FMN-dependent NADH-azoreductase